MITSEIVAWCATALTVVAAFLVAADLGRRITGWGFVLFTGGSLAWIISATLDADAPLGTTNLILLVANAIGVWRWLIARAAPAAS